MLATACVSLPFPCLAAGAKEGYTKRVSHCDLHQLAEKLSNSQILKDYERAFSEATGLPLSFQPAG